MKTVSFHRAAGAVFAMLSIFLWPAVASADPESGTPEILGPMPDPYLPPGDLASDSHVGPKFAAGAKWTFVGYTLDQQAVIGVFDSGTVATGTFAQCPILPQPFLLTVMRDGQLFGRYSTNAWGLIEFNSNKCGLSIRFPKPTQYEVLTPGNYEFRMTQAGSANIAQSTAVPPCAAPTTMYAARHDVYTDNFYTILYSDFQIALKNHGYANTGVPFKVSRTNQLTVPFKRYFKGAPQIEHFYSHLPTEGQTVFDLGYVFERDEGHVFPTALPGTVGLYRLAKYNGANGDLQHVYTTSVAESNTYQGQGWASDGVKGFVCTANSGSTKLMPGGSLSAGSEQSAPLNTAFANPLTVTVRDEAGNPLPNATVAFAAPESGASAVLSATTATTSANGSASVTATANATDGPYFVTASAAGAANVANFKLTNTGCSGTGYTYESAALTGPNTWGPDMTFADGTVATFRFTVPTGGAGRMRIMHHTAYTTYPLPDTVVMSISTCKGDFNVSSACTMTSGQYVEVPFSTTGAGGACVVQPGETYYMNIKQTACYYGSSGVCGLRGYRTSL